MGHPALIEALNNVKYSYNSYTLSHAAIISGVEAVKDREYFIDCVEKIKKTRGITKEYLTELGFTFPKSGTNFIFATHRSIPAKVIFEALRSKDIYVRYFNLPRLNNSLRITIGTEEVMAQLYRFLKEFIEKCTK